MAKLSVKAVQSAIKAAKPVRLGDGEGLQLFINKAGAAYWVLRFRHSGKDFERSLGRATEISLADARENARVLRKELIAAHDAPPAESVPEKEPVPSFMEAARQHHAVVAPTLRNAKHSAQWLSSLETYAFPHFGSKPVDEVDEGDIVKSLLPIWGTKRETAGRVMQRIRAVLSAAKGRGWRSAAIDWDAVNAALPRVKKNVRHMASVPFEEVPDFVRRLGASASSPSIRAALAYLIATAVRPGNIITVEWSHVDLENRTWTIPADLMKGGLEHRVYLPDGAMAALEIAAARRTAKSELIFPGQGGDRPLSLDTLRMAMRRMNSEATPHGFRSSFKNWSLHNDYPDHLSERQLAHVDANQVRRAYARTDQFEQRRDMMIAWDKFVRGG